jgi:hypothetical protein
MRISDSAILTHDPEKWIMVSRKGRAQTGIWSTMMIRPQLIAPQATREG